MTSNQLPLASSPYSDATGGENETHLEEEVKVALIGHDFVCISGLSWALFALSRALVRQIDSYTSKKESRRTRGGWRGGKKGCGGMDGTGREASRCLALLAFEGGAATTKAPASQSSRSSNQALPATVMVQRAKQNSRGERSLRTVRRAGTDLGASSNCDQGTVHAFTRSRRSRCSLCPSAGSDDEYGLL